MKPKLGKPFRTPKGPKKFSVYVKNDKGNEVKVNFGDPDMEIKRDDPARRKAFRDRHGCDNPGPRWKPKYWSCKLWSGKPVSKIVSGEAAKTEKVATGKKAQPGISVPFWFYGTEAFRKGDPKIKSVIPPKEKRDLPTPASADEQVQKMLVETPDMPAAALVQALKSKGLKIEDQKQADSATTQSPVLRSQEAAAPIAMRARFLESWKDNGVGPTRFKVALIQEGMGNLKDAFYYTREALETGIAAFEGKKCFADHPSRSEESDRPERSVRDIVGHFESVHLEEREDGGSMLCADLVLLPDPSFEWARALVRHALEYSKKYQGQEFIGLSINAAGDAQSMDLEKFLREGDIPAEAKPKLEKALQEGITSVRVVNAIADAVSTDLVTEPGARGKILEMLESERKKTMPKKMKHAEDEAKKQSEAEMKQEEAKQEAMPPKAEAEDGEEKPEGEDHADEEQDKALILDMIKKHMGEACEGMEQEGEKAAHEAYEAYKEMGKDHEEALKCAAEAMKLAKHMAAKQEESEVKAAEAEDEKEAEEVKHSESVVRLTGNIAMLERKLKGYELAATLDKKLAESKLGRAETDKIRTLIGAPKSETHIVETIKVFKEAFSMAGGSESAKPSFASLFITGSEKQEETPKAKISFSECLK